MTPNEIPNSQTPNSGKTKKTKSNPDAVESVELISVIRNSITDHIMMDSKYAEQLRIILQRIGVQEPETPPMSFITTLFVPVPNLRAKLPLFGVGVLVRNDADLLYYLSLQQRHANDVVVALFRSLPMARPVGILGQCRDIQVRALQALTTTVIDMPFMFRCANGKCDIVTYYIDDNKVVDEVIASIYCK